MVRLDILLTLGMMRYVVDQREGRMEPHKADAKLFATVRDVDVDWDALRKTAFEAPDMKTFLEQQAPPFPQYGQLRKKLAEYRAIAAKGGWPRRSGLREYGRCRVRYGAGRGRQRIPEAPQS